MQEEFAGRVDIVGVAGSSSSVEDMQGFIDDTGVGGFDHVADLENQVWARYEIRTQPRFVFIDDDGSHEVTPGMGRAALVERIDALVAG